MNDMINGRTGQYEPMLTIFRTRTGELCDLAIIFDTNPETRVERIPSIETGLRVGTTPVRGPGSMVPRTKMSKLNVTSVDVRSESEKSEDESMTMEDRHTKHAVLIGHAPSETIAALTERVVTRSLADWMTWQVESFIVAVRQGMNLDLSDPEGLAAHVRGHLFDLAVQWGIDMSQDIITIAFDRDGDEPTLIIIERIFDIRNTSSMNERAAQLNAVTPPRPE